MNMLPQASPAPSIIDIVPPIDVFPYPLWMVLTAGGVALLLAALAIWLFVKWRRRRPVALPPTPQEIALTALEKARARLEELEPYAFSILVSDVLRTFVTARFGLHATQQTSPEFLESLTLFSSFTHDEKALLAAFLEKCDLIKFARVSATHADSAALLEQAIHFVKGAAVRPPAFPEVASSHV